ncbi:peroxiredoxin family protein [Nocardia sp. NPDC051321]|uniref:peroxiredoxin family protein n=1 Tax=Nocardia sp. NPDC051321 TaxID=3364323 RepID=UPI0037935AEB
MTVYGVWIGRLVVAVVFGWAAWAKLADRPGTRQGLQDFGIPTAVLGAAVWGLPAVELVVAVAVLPSQTAVWAGVGALVLVAAFTTVVIGLLARGRRPACSCFGAASSAPIGPATLVRNTALAVLTGLVVWGSVRYDDVPQQLPLDRAVGLAAIIVFAALMLRGQLELAQLRRELAKGLAARKPRQPLPVGATAPRFAFDSTDGQRRSLDEAVALGLPVLLLFFSPGCPPCESIAAELPRWRERLAVTTVVIGTGHMAANTQWAREHGVDPVLVPGDSAIVARYGLTGTPSAVLIDTEGRIASHLEGGSYAISDLVETIASPRHIR